MVVRSSGQVGAGDVVGVDVVVAFKVTIALAFVADDYVERNLELLPVSTVINWVRPIYR